MPPKPKSKGKKTKGVTVSVSLTKRTKRAARCNQVPVIPVQALDQTLQEDDPASGQNGVSEKLEMIWVLVALSIRIQATEDKQK